MKLLTTLPPLMLFMMLASAAHADDLIEGKSLYSKGQYNRAAESFKKVIDRDRSNSTAHYYMANCYVAKHDWGEAKAEYQQAAATTRDPKVQEYCLSVISNLEVAHPSSGVFRKNAGASNSAFDEAQARAQAEVNRSTNEMKFVNDQTERQVKLITEERDAALRPLDGVTRSMTPFGTQDERDAVRAPYDKRIEELRNRGKLRTSDIQNQGESAARKSLRE